MESKKNEIKRLVEVINQLPEFKGQVRSSRGMITTWVLHITQEEDVFIIHIRLGADPLLTAKLVHHLSRKFGVKIGDPCFISEDRKMYWGEEAMRAYEEICSSRPPEPINEKLLRIAFEQCDLENFYSITEN